MASRKRRLQSEVGSDSGRCRRKVLKPAKVLEHEDTLRAMCVDDAAPTRSPGSQAGSDVIFDAFLSGQQGSSAAGDGSMPSSSGVHAPSTTTAPSTEVPRDPSQQHAGHQGDDVGLLGLKLDAFMSQTAAQIANLGTLLNTVSSQLASQPQFIGSTAIPGVPAFSGAASSSSSPSTAVTLASVMASLTISSPATTVAGVSSTPGLASTAVSYSSQQPLNATGGATMNYEDVASLMIHAFSKLSDEDQEKVGHVLQFVPLLTSSQLPQLPPSGLRQLVEDFKSFGNKLFSQNEVFVAGEFYTHAIRLALLMIDEGHYIDREVASLICTNRAACLLRLELYYEALENCDLALNLDEENLKGYYRKAQALKLLNAPDKASLSAHEGLHRSLQSGKTAYVTNFKQLIREIDQILQAPSKEPSSSPSHIHIPQPAPRQPPKAATKQSQTPWPTKPPVPPTSTTTASKPSKKKQTQEATKMTKKLKATTNVNGSGSGVTASDLNGADPAWLEGGNILPKSTQSPKAQVKKKKKKSYQSSTYKGRFDVFTADLESSEEDVEEDEDQENGAGTSWAQYNSHGNNIDQLGMGLDSFDYGSKGLNQPNIPVTRGQDNVKKPKKVPASNNTLAASSHAKSAANPTIPSTVVPPLLAPSPFVSKLDENTFIRSFLMPTLPPPFHEYQVTMACNTCYTRIQDGFRYLPDIPHNCLSNCLLVRQNPQQPWSKVRPRIKNDYYGQYILCRHFSQGLNCKVPENRCQYAHNLHELYLWTVDRKALVDIFGFIGEQHRLISQGKAQFTQALKEEQWRHQQAEENKAQRLAQFQQSVARTQTNVPRPSPQKTNPNKPAQQQTGNKPTHSHVTGKPEQSRPTNKAPPNSSKSGEAKVQSSSDKLKFPLEDSHDWRLACNECILALAKHGFYTVNENIKHQCHEELLLVRLKGHPHWHRIRERLSHRNFKGRYILCRNFTANPPMPCAFGGDLCSYAHSFEEQQLWGAEKDNTVDFSIPAFIAQNKSTGTKQELSEFFRKHGGYLTFICKACFYGQPPRVSVQNPNEAMECQFGHAWTQCRMLAHVLDGNISLIEERKFKHEGAFYRMCGRKQFCHRQGQGNCWFAHSSVEHDMWMLENVLQEDRYTIAKKYLELCKKSMKMEQSGDDAKAEPPKKQINCPFRIEQICLACWKSSGLKSYNAGERCSSNKTPHLWSINAMYLLVPVNKQIRPLPRKIGRKFTICKQVQQRRPCLYQSGSCQFAHSKEEKEVWDWMVSNGVADLEELYGLSHPVESDKTPASAAAAAAANGTSKSISKGQSVVSAWQKPPQDPAMQLQASPARTPLEPVKNAFYCPYCSVSCNSDSQWQQHKASDKHIFNVNSDREHQWNYRQPPWGVTNGKYRLCDSHCNHSPGRCEYSSRPDMYNLCRFAHSHGELSEWQERWQWRRMKRNIAQQEEIFSYMENLQEEFEMSSTPAAVLAEHVPDVEIQCDSLLSMFKENKDTQHVWNFTITHKQKVKLQRVALLYNRDRLHFSLVGPDMESNCQFTDGDTVRDLANPNLYHVSVEFLGTMFGSFHQWLLFDFDTRPVTVCKLNIEVGNPFVQEKVLKLRQKLNLQRWTESNRDICAYDEEEHARNERSLIGQLMRKYRAPDSAEAIVNQQSMGVDLNRHNYVHKMHAMLQLEELERCHIINGFNLCMDLELMDKIEHEFGTILPLKSGDRFACLQLEDELSEDTDAGNLILSSVNKILIGKPDAKKSTVYEAPIVRRRFFDGRSHDKLYVAVSARFCKDLNIVSVDKFPAEVQFQLDRMRFCRMHYAIDLLDLRDNIDKVFPDVSKINPDWHEHHDFTLKTSVLNSEQMKIVRHVIAERTGYTPPLIVYGPWGTGKTETLAQSAMVLLEHRPLQTVRILICAQSNSAADLYITKHFDAFIKTRSQVQLLRVYATERHVGSVDGVVKQYCLMTHDSSRFRGPSREDVMAHNVVITTLNSFLLLTHRRLEGEFTHIFIDEAAQAFECEAVMALTLADENTCVVMTGDHMQTTQRLYSAEAHRQRLDRSLLERLYHHYEVWSQLLDQTSPLNILLTVNYRTRPEILKFISRIFYGGTPLQENSAALPDCSEIHPLIFYNAQGQEMHGQQGVSWYNMAEVEELVDRVEWLRVNWPLEWGKFDEKKSIGIVTPYNAQVRQIRTALRNRSQSLASVTVESIGNMQGKEFDAIFISTVRTRALLTSKTDCTSEEDEEELDYGFLTNRKLLNTALTRARCLVAVVGDAIALCSVGACANIWRVFLKECAKLDSLHPYNLTLDLVQEQIRALLAEKRNSTPPAPKKVKATSAIVQNAISSTVHGSTRVVSKLPERGVSVIEEEEEDEPGVDWAAQGGFFDDGSVDCMVEPDRIINQLAKQVAKVAVSPQHIHAKVLQTTSAKSSSATPASGSNSTLSATDSDPLKVGCVRVKEQDGHVVVSYSAPSKKKRERHTRTGQDFDSDVDISDDDDSGSAGGTSPRDSHIYIDYTPQQLTDMEHTQPHKYKRGVLHIESSARMYVRLSDPVDHARELTISNRLRCGRGFDGDDVLVEVLEKNTDNEEDGNSTEVAHQGCVVGIIQRHINPRYRMFICQVDPNNTGMFVPLNRGIPKLYNLEIDGRGRKGHVTVYTLTSDKDIIFHHHEPIDPVNPESKMFVVRYLKWDAKFYSPLGIVVGVLPAGTTVPNGLRILRVEHYIPSSFRVETIDEVETAYPEGYQIPPEARRGRVNMLPNLVFTVDPDGSKDLDDALSVENVKGSNHFLVGVHIADVSYFVKPNTSLDAEAHSRGQTYYGIGCDPVPMLPERLSNDLISLVPGQERLALSLFIHVDSEGKVMKVTPRRTLLESKHRLTYSDAEEIITGQRTDCDPLLLSSVITLHRLAQMWKKRRIGQSTGPFAHEQERMDTPKSHVMIEEIMIQANTLAAGLLIARYPECTPLRCQAPPSPYDIATWQSLFTGAAFNTTGLNRPFLPDGAFCQCIDQCTCVPSPSVMPEEVIFDIASWSQLQDAMVNKDVSALINIVQDPLIQPNVAQAALQLRAIQDRATYKCTEQQYLGLETYYHYSLNSVTYCHFTSPIRRYIDLVVHRLLLAAIDRQTQPPYSAKDMREICDHCTQVAVKARRYDQATHSLHLAVALEQHPVSAYSLITEADESQITVRCPRLHDFVPSQGRIHLNLLKVSEQPAAMEDGGVAVKWKWRVYDKDGPLSVVSAKAGENRLNPMQHIIGVNQLLWQKMLGLSRMNDGDQLTQLALVANEMSHTHAKDEGFVSDFSCEVKSDRIKRLDTTSTLDLKPGNPLLVQLSSQIRRGILAPTMQLVSLTPRLDICLEHRQDPVRCFATLATCQASRQNYGSIDCYIQAWHPVMAVETASLAVGNDEGAIIHNVIIDWRQDDNEKYRGHFSFSDSFCEERRLKFTGNDSEASVILLDEVCYDYVCIRYHALKVDMPPEAAKLDIDLQSVKDVIWVGHAEIIHVLPDKEGRQLHLDIRLRQSNMPFPEQLLHSKRSATIEWLPKPLPQRRMERALLSLAGSCELAQDIALGRSPAALEAAYLHPIPDPDRMKTPLGFHPPNDGQKSSLKKAVSQPFTLIQGPPGTGKTVTGAQLALMFSLANRTVPASRSNKWVAPQLIYCGPSNKSVDVVAGYLKKLGPQCPRLVRVYSERIEQEDFPLPHEAPRRNRKLAGASMSMDPNCKDIALHHLVRLPDRPDSDKLRKYDELFRKHGENVNPQDVQEYKILLTNAYIKELKEAHVILCTCTVSSSPKITMAVNIAQVIVDECGMCMEPESMIPIITLRPKQVVLLGDHMQLQPIVNNPVAKKLGLETSLFERYSDRAEMLTVQYRMHEAIAEFPSQLYYKGQLECGLNEQTRLSAVKFWPNGRNKPIAFVHIVGEEVCQSVATEEGGVRSRSNLKEAMLAVRVALHLIRRASVRPRDVVILTQYRAQCVLLETLLKEKGESEINVSTAIASQGSEWDHVILSTVRSLPQSQIEPKPTLGWRRRNLGFITDGHQINVAITRARKGLIILGNKNLLVVDEMWHKLISHYETQKKVFSAAQFMAK